VASDTRKIDIQVGAIDLNRPRGDCQDRVAGGSVNRPYLLMDE
jgi:hypothetical protein